MELRWKCLSVGSLFILALFQGCAPPLVLPKLCSVRAAHSGELNSLLLSEEPAGYLVAKLLRCGEREFYLASVSNSNSSSIVTAFIEDNAHAIPARWDMRIGCPEALDAYPVDGAKTEDFLSSLCSKIAVP